METEPRLCGCGCGEPVNPGRRFVKGHYARTIPHEELLRRVFRGHAGHRHSEEARQKQREARRRFIANGGQVWNKGLTKDVHPSVGLHNKGQFQSAADHYERSFPTTSTTLEAIVQIALWERGIPFLFNVPIRHVCRPDFILPDARIVINVDAAYWHRDRKDKDASQDATLEAEGWLVFRWDEETIKAHLPALMEEVQTAYGSRLSCQGSVKPNPD